MSLSDPQSVTLNAVAQSMPRVYSGPFENRYQKADRTVSLQVKHTITKTRARSLIRLDQTKIATDPLVTTVNVQYGTGVYMVIDRPLAGFSNTELLYLTDGFAGYLTASSSANAIKIIALES